MAIIAGASLNASLGFLEELWLKISDINSAAVLIDCSKPMLTRTSSDLDVSIVISEAGAPLETIAHLKSLHFSAVLKLATSTTSEYELDETHERVMTLALRILSEFCGRSASGPLSKQWIFTNFEGASRITLLITEPTFASAGLGWKTWGSSVLLSRLLLTKKIIAETGAKVLELGCGTGLVGLTLSRYMPDVSVTMTDYQPAVLENARLNVMQNQLLACRVQYLNWFDDLALTKEEKYSNFLAADVIYGMEEATAIPRVVEALLEEGGSFHIVMPLRKTHHQEVELFFQEMRRLKFQLVQTEEYWLPELDASGESAQDEMCTEGIWYKYCHFKMMVKCVLIS